MSEAVGARCGLANVRATAGPRAALSPQRPLITPSFPSIRVNHGVLCCPDDAVGALDLLSITRQCRAAPVGRMQSRAGYVRTTDLLKLPLADFETSRREHS